MVKSVPSSTTVGPSMKHVLLTFCTLDIWTHWLKKSLICWLEDDWFMRENQVHPTKAHNVWTNVCWAASWRTKPFGSLFFLNNFLQFQHIDKDMHYHYLSWLVWVGAVWPQGWWTGQRGFHWVTKSHLWNVSSEHAGRSGWQLHSCSADGKSPVQK